MSSPSREERLRGGILGLLIGDALGVPYEFREASELPPLSELEMKPPTGFPRAHASTPPGTWSDDGAQALCLLASLLDQGALDPRDLANRLVNWIEWGYMAVDDRVFDVGIQTGRALDAVRAGVPPLGAGPSGERDNGNGSLMRVLPLALWHRGSDAELMHDACLQSRITHGHPRAQACCALYVMWARALLHEAARPWTHALDVFRGTYSQSSPLRTELERVIVPAFAGAVQGSGYVVDSLHAAVALNERASYEDVVRAAISLGDDTDTTACIAGGIAGIRFGEQGIPVRWREQLRGQDLVEPQLARLMQRLAP